MEFLCDEWLVDVATDYAGKATTHCRRAHPDRALAVAGPAVLLRHRRAARHGKTTTLTMLIMAVTGDAASGGGVVDQRGGAAQGTDELLPLGMPYILWDNIARGTADLVPAHREVLHLRVLFRPQARRQRDGPRCHSTIHFFTGNNIGAKGDLASRSLHIRLDVDRVDPENRTFKHPDPVGWTENHRAEILAALYTILLGNPQLKAARDAEGKTGFKMWWRLVGSAVENAARLTGQELDFQKLFITQEEDDEESASLADVLDVLVKKWPDQFTAKDVAGMINNPSPNEDEQTLRDYLLPGALPNHVFSAKSIGKRLKHHLDGPVRSGERTLVLRWWEDSHLKVLVYGVVTLKDVVEPVCGVCGVCFRKAEAIF